MLHSRKSSKLNRPKHARYILVGLNPTLTGGAWGLKAAPFHPIIIARLSSRKQFALCGTKVADVGLNEIAKLKAITKLDVTNEGVAELQKALPKCKIER